MEKELYKPFKYTGNGTKKFSVYVKGQKETPKLIHFGDSRYEDYTQHKDQKRRTAYLKRAKGIKNRKGQLTWKLKDTANYWATHYLWDA